MADKRLGCKWSRFWLGSDIWKPTHLKSRQMAAILSTVFDIWTKTSGFQMVKIIAMAFALAWPFKNRDIKWSDFRTPLYVYYFNYKAVLFFLPGMALSSPSSSVNANNTKSLERLSDRSYFKDWIRLGLINSDYVLSVAGSKLHGPTESFRVTTVNYRYSAVASYPALLLVPANGKVTDDFLKRYCRFHRQSRYFHAGQNRGGGVGAAPGATFKGVPIGFLSSKLNNC